MKALTSKDIDKELSGYADILPDVILEEIKQEALDSKVSAKEFKLIISEIKKRVDYAQVEAGEAVGVVAAQSLGEPGTQMTMRRLGILFA